MRRLRVLGPLEVDGAAEVLGPRDRVVVSALALRPGERVDAETLAEALWGEEPPASAAKVVQGCVSRLRKALGADAIETVDGGYRVRSDELAIDRQQFEDQVVRARGYLATRTPERAIPLLVDSLALWRGPAFGELEDWMPGRLEAVRLGQLRLAAEEDLLQARLDCGDHAGVAADGTVLTGQQPFRERRWALLALAQYRSGRQADALASIRSARRALGQELGLDPGSELVLLEQRILAQDPGLATDHEARMADASCPWKGLAPYGDRDGDTFFGRDADIAACLARLGESPLLVVTGPSGSGKSSLVQAGLVPALRASGAEVEVFTPGADGALAMAAARTRRTGDPLLVIDQFEETFTLRGAGFSRPWLGDVARYAQQSAPVVVVVRGDHVADLGADEELARLAERGLHLVAPLTGELLREAVEGPARVAGLRWEPGLVDLVVRDADGQPGALPLLSHALAETWQRREGGLLTVDGYRAAGGISDAVAASAERLYDGLSPDERDELRWLMLRLVSLSESGEPFRTPLPASVVPALDPVRRRLLDLLVRGRLVTSADGGFDLAHEALVRAWPRLRVWLDEDRAGQQIRRHLAMSAAGWETLDRADTELYRGSRLAASLDWLERGDEPLPDSEREFVAASRAIARDRMQRLAEDARRQRRQNRRLRVLVAAATVLLVVAATAGVVARDRGLAAERGQDSATESAASARHEALVARSVGLRATSKILAALLAVQAWRDRPDVLAESALIASLGTEPGLLGYRTVQLADVEDTPVAAVALPDSDQVLVAVGSSVILTDPDTGRSTTAAFSRRVAASSRGSALRVGADGTHAVHLISVSNDARCSGTSRDQARGCTQLVVYDVTTRAPVLGPLTPPFGVTDIAISDDGSIVAVAGARGAVATWDVQSARLLGASRPAASAGRPSNGTVAFGRGDRLYVGASGPSVREVSARTLRIRREITVPVGASDRRLLVVDDRLLASGDLGQFVVDLRNGSVLWSDRSRGCLALAVSSGIGATYCATDNGEVVVRDLVTGEQTGLPLEPQLGNLGDLVVADRRGELLAFSERNPDFARWRLDGSGGCAWWSPVRSPSAATTRRGGCFSSPGPTARPRLSGPRTGRPCAESARDAARPGSRRAPWACQVATSSWSTSPPAPADLCRCAPTCFYPEPGGTHAWAASRRGVVHRFRRISLATGRVTGPALEPVHAADVRLASDGASLFVTDGGDANWGTQQYDIATGALLAGGLYLEARVAVAGGGILVAADETGRLREYKEVGFTAPLATFPRARSAASSVQISSDGERFLVTSADTVQVYDRVSRTRLGDPFPSQAPEGVLEGWLRPDGLAMLTNTRFGVVEWDLSPEGLVAAACDLAGRNALAAEWQTFIGSGPVTRICPEYSLPEEFELHPDF